MHIRGSCSTWCPAGPSDFFLHIYLPAGLTAVCPAAWGCSLHTHEANQALAIAISMFKTVRAAVPVPWQESMLGELTAAAMLLGRASEPTNLGKPPCLNA